MQKLFLILVMCACKTAFSQASPLKPGSIGYLLNRSLDFSREKNYDRALVLVDSAMMIDSNNRNIFALRAELLWMMERFSEAAADYQQSLLLDKNERYLFGAYVFLGVLYEKANKQAQAQAQYLKAVYFFENKKRKTDRHFVLVNKMDYALALKFSGNDEAWDKLLTEPFYKESLKPYIDKTRKEILDLYFEPYRGH